MSATYTQRLACLAALWAVASCGPSAPVQRVAPNPVQNAPVPAQPMPQLRKDGRLPQGAVPRKTALSLQLDPRAQGFTGQTQITLHAEAPLQHVMLHAQALRIARAQLGGRDAAVQSAGDVLTVSLPAPLPAGEHVLSIEFAGDYSDNLDGLYRAGDAIYTDFEPTDARKAFPCFDEPSYKMPYDVRVRVPKGQLAFGNARELRREELAEHTEFTFATTRPIPSYLVAVAAGELQVIEGTPAQSREQQVPVRVIGQAAALRDPERAQLALQVARETLPLFEAWFDLPYPYDKIDLVAVPNFASGAMENVGLITFREERLLAHPVQDARKWQRSVAIVLVHELAHQWFGNLVTSAWWDDIWLNEGFASFMEGEILDAWRPDFGARLDRLVEAQKTMDLDSLPSARRVREPVQNAADAREAFDSVTYDKGAMLLAMVQNWIGPEALRQAISRYLRAHADGNATSAQLFAELDKAAPVAGQKVSAWLAPWLAQPGVPWLDQVQPARAWAARGVAPHPGSWPVPICQLPGVCAPFGADTKRGEVRFGGLYARGRAQLGSDASSADALALQWNYWAALRREPTANALQEYAKYTKSQLTPAAKRQLLESLWTQSTQLRPALLGSARGDAFAAELRAALWPLWQRSRSDAAASDEQVLSRRALAHLLVDVAGDRRVTTELNRKLRAHLQSPNKPARAAVDEQLLWFELGARQGDAALWALLHARWQKARSAAERIDAQTALFGFEDRALLARSLALLIEGVLPAQDLAYALRAITARPQHASWFNAWLSQHWQALRAKYPQGALLRASSALAALCDQRELEQVLQGYPREIAAIEGGARGVELAKEHAQSCALLREQLLQAP